MSRNPAVCLAAALVAISVQAALASPVIQRPVEVRCHDSPTPALEAAGVARITADIAVDVASDEPCLWGRVQLALEAALEHIAPLARERRLPCPARCWLDRPTSAIARVGLRDSIWPSPPAIDRWLDAGWVIVIVLVPDLTESWWWIAVSPPDRDGRVELEVVGG